jgi:hypothetical protein
MTRMSSIRQELNVRQEVCYYEEEEAKGVWSRSKIRNFSPKAEIFPKQ